MAFSIEKEISEGGRVNKKDKQGRQRIDNKYNGKDQKSPGNNFWTIKKLQAKVWRGSASSHFCVCVNAARTKALQERELEQGVWTALPDLWCHSLEPVGPLCHPLE